jgi:D-3-phosphoglycerate dehydrogenase
MPRILVSDSLSEAGLDALRSIEGFEVDFQPGLDEAQLAEAIKSADGLIIRSGSKVTARVIEAADRLRVIGRAGIGVDNIDQKAASKRGIVVMNTPTGNAVTTAEHSISLMMSLARWIPQATASLRAGKWEKKKLQGRELAGKTLGVIGLGTIGRIVADRAMGLKMRVVAFDPMLSRDRATELGVELVTLEELWPVADVITVHTPLTPQTRGLINDEVVGKLKEGVLLINCARGGIYDEDAVARGLESGHIGGAAFDVFMTEPPPADHKLVPHPRVVCSPHLGASTREAQERVAVQIAEQVAAFLQSGEIKNALNVTSLSSEAAEKLSPYIELAEKLGSFLAQVEEVENEAQPSCIEVECTGEAAALGADAITSAAVAGVLRCFLDVPVNRVSAPHIANDRGIAVREQKSTAPAGQFASQVVVRVKGKNTCIAAGALGSDRTPRLVQWDDFEIEARLGGTALVVESNDTPGVIGFMGTTLGGGGVNIASVYLGKSPPDAAVSMWNLDDDLPEEVLQQVRDSENVRRAVVVRL